MGIAICSLPETERQRSGKPTPLLLRFREKITGVVCVNPLCSDHSTYSGETQSGVSDYDSD